MNEMINPNDISHVVEADKAHVWHHLTNHSKFSDVDPLIIVEGKGLRVTSTCSFVVTVSALRLKTLEARGKTFCWPYFRYPVVSRNFRMTEPANFVSVQRNLCRIVVAATNYIEIIFGALDCLTRKNGP